MTYEPLAGITVLDFSHRLPGPLSTLQLKKLGARVIKIEDSNFGDPFDGGSFDEMDSSFSDWYITLNLGKEVRKLNLKTDKVELETLIKEASIILMGLPEKVQKKYSLSFEDCIKLRDHGVFLEMTSSREQSFGMHDLNALAKNGLLELHIRERTSENAQWIAPPFLPVAGISFASHLATEALAGLLKAVQTKTWIKRTAALEEAVQSLLNPLFSNKLRQTDQRDFLHNGRYPCYAIYPLKDKGYLAVASVEAKYWERFCETFKVGITPEDRFKNDPEIFKTVSVEVSKYTHQEAAKLCDNLDACVSLVS
jgi:alpha-methylacyl-CoA racemase